MKRTSIAVIFISIISILHINAGHAQKFQPIYDELKVPQYSLPDPLLLANGKKVEDAETWWQKRRPMARSPAICPTTRSSRR